MRHNKGHEVVIRLFTCAGISVVITWSKKSAFLFDSYSLNNQKFHDHNSKITLPEFRLKT